MRKEHDCEACRLRAAGLSEGATLATVAEHDRQAIAQFGWTAHHIVDGQVPSAHTHGLMERFEHLDVQVVLPATPETIQALLAPIAVAVTRGRRFGAGDEVRGVFNVPLRFVERPEGGRTVLRALFPDPEGRWPDDPNVAAGYELQLALLEGEAAVSP